MSNKHKSPAHNSRGLTIVEILIVVSFMFILAYLATPIYENTFVSSQLDESSNQVLQTIRLARERSVARVDGRGHGVYFEVNPEGKDAYILYQGTGTSFAQRVSASDQRFELDEPISLLPTFLGNDINFAKGVGTTSEGSVTISHSSGGSETIIVGRFGAAGKN